MSMFRQEDERRRDFGEAVRLARKRVGLTQHSLSAITGIEQTTISNWENGKNWPYVKLFNDFIGGVKDTFAERDIRRIEEIFYNTTRVVAQDDIKTICQKYCRFIERTDIPDDALKLICAGCPVQRLFGE